MDKDVFKDNVVIITGASSGIGRQLAFHLAPQGARLVLAARDAARLEATAEGCRQAGAQALIVPIDVTSPKQCQELVQRTVQAYGRLDTLINNAGTSLTANFEDYNDPTDLEHLAQINYLGSAYITYFALPYLKQSRGRIAAVCSMAGLTGLPGLSGYAASKFAMSGFFESIRIELKRHGISVTIAYPASVATHLENTPTETADPAGEKTRQAPREKIPPGMMPVETCARLILQAVAGRRRDLYMAPGGKAILWIKLIAPALLDRISLTAVEKDRAERKETPV
ncbi:MAG: SDR family oxidoreductase [Anaerolineaceae bacterium]|nr:SDR family oxidoreductase [Anaerolineaceae bacterium]